MASRSGEVISSYRTGLRLSRAFPDPTARSYLVHRLMALFRRRQGEVSAARVTRHLHEARKSVRRVGRAVAGDSDDIRYIVELAHGKRGRFMHLLKHHELTPRPLPPAAEPPPQWGGAGGLPRTGGGGADGQGWGGRLSLGPGEPGYRPPVQHAPGWEARHVALIRAAAGKMPAEVPDMSRRRRRLYQDVFDIGPPRLRIWTEIDGEGVGRVVYGHRQRVLGELPGVVAAAELPRSVAAAAERGEIPARGPPDAWPSRAGEE